MSYETFRTAIVTRLNDKIPIAILRDVIQEIDCVAKDYDFTRKSVDLIVPGEVPDVVKMYCASLAVENKATGTIRGYYQILSRFFKTVRKSFMEVTTNDIRVFLFEYQREHNLKKSTLEHLRVVINAFYQWCVEEEIMERNPARKIEPIKVPDSPRHAMTSLELEYLRESCTNPREKALVDFLYSTGCRVSECANVTMKDIDWQNRSVFITHGKGDKSRTVYFNPECEVSLRAYLDSKKVETEYLFSRCRQPYCKMSGKALQDIIINLCVKASKHLNTHITPHVFRHTMATTALRNGMPVEQVQQLLGHSSLDTTMIYAKTEQESVKSSYQKYVT